MRKPTSDPPPRILTVREVAEIRRVSTSTVRRWVKAHEIVAEVSDSGRTIRIAEDDNERHRVSRLQAASHKSPPRRRLTDPPVTD